MTRTEAHLVKVCAEAEGNTPQARQLYQKVWSVLAKIVERELGKGSRVCVPQLGTFGVVMGDPQAKGGEGWPYFEPKPDLLSQFRMDYEGPRAGKGEKAIPVAEVKPGSLARSTGYDLETCRIAYDDLMDNLRKELATGEKFVLNLRVGSLTLLPAGHLLFSPKPVRVFSSSAAPPKDGIPRLGTSDQEVDIPEFCPVPPNKAIRQALEDKLRDNGPEDLKVREMEALLSRRSKREVELAKNGPQTARAVLEENKILSERKKLAGRNDRAASLVMVESLLALEKESVEKDKAKQQGRREAHQQLAQQYKASIVQKEKEKGKRFEAKMGDREKEDAAPYFPFTEGETVQEYREHANAQLREEMREFISVQRQQKPPRADALMDSVKADYNVLYPLAPNARNVGGGAYLKETVAPPPADGPAIVPYVCETHPRFLKRSREYMSRRTETTHVKKAMEDKIDRTKQQLEFLAEDRQAEKRMHEDGLIINDALRYDNELLKGLERKQNAEYIKQQIDERKVRRDSEKSALKGEGGGYWGPEEKNVYTDAVKMQHRRELVAQMEVNQNRKLDSRDRKLRQERCIVENGVLEMMADRDRNTAKVERRRSALNRAWNNQVLIKRAQQQVDHIGR